VSGVYRFVPGLPVLGKYFPTVEQQVASGHAVYAELAQSNEEEVAKFARALEARSRATIVRNS
jgi:hypothetical protein